MLHRSTSSRRRRASRSMASSPQTTRTPRSAATSPGRRASIAVSPVDSERILRSSLAPEINRSPRHSIIPDISLDSRNSRDSTEDIPLDDTSRGRDLSPRGSLVPDSSFRSPRHSLVPNDVPYSRSPRNSLVPDSALSPRNSLVPESAYNRSPRGSLVPDISKTPRGSLVPEVSKTPRGSLIPDVNKSPRSSLVPGDINRSPRHSLTPEAMGYSSRSNLAPDFNRSPRNSLVPDIGRSSRQILSSPENITWSNGEERGSRHNLIPDGNRSPRGSIAPESLCVKTSPRGSIGSEYMSDRSPRGSIAYDSDNRSPRGSIAKGVLASEDRERSPRGSLTLTFQEPPCKERRASADNIGTRGNRSTSPYRSVSKGNVSQAHGASFESGSRRASSSVSQVGLPQVSGDEQRRLCNNDQKYDSEGGLRLGISLTTYGSVAYQLKDANLESSSTCDFICKALHIVNRTVVATVCLGLLSILPLLMVIFGFQFLRDCPREPNIPIYMVVGGSVGCIKMCWLLYDQLHTRRMDPSSANASSIGSKIAAIALTIFLISWFALGNYWILGIKWPDYAPTLHEPNKWCHRTLYIFSLVHLGIVYMVIGVIVILVIVLGSCQLFGCHWLGPHRYK